MNNKIIFCQLAITLFATSLCAGAPSMQELQEQLAAKRQELHELTERIMQQEKLVDECASNVNTHIDRHLGRKTSVDEKAYKETLRECRSFFEQFFTNQKKDILLDMFIKEDSKLNFAKFYYLCLFYEEKNLTELIKKWEQTARQLNALQDQISRSN